MEFLKKIRNLLLIFALVGIATAYIDYTRITNGESPAFCKETFNERNNELTCRGIFYVTDRVVKRSPSEKLNLSKSIKYRFLNQTINIKLERPKEKQDFVLYVTPSLECPSPSYLYYEEDNQKIYLDCIASVKIKENNQKESVDLKDALEKNKGLIETIIKKTSLIGIESDKTTEKYINLDNQFINKSITIYRCNKDDIKDIYITMNNTMADDYCILKNDSLPKEQE